MCRGTKKKLEREREQRILDLIVITFRCIFWESKGAPTLAALMCLCPLHFQASQMIGTKFGAV